MKTFYIQSFYQYPVTFSAIGKTIPARSAQGEMKNIAEVSEKELEKLENCEPFFRELVNKKKFRVLNHIPASYVPPAKQINDAHEEADKLRKENEELKAKLATLKALEEGKTIAKVEIDENSNKSYTTMTPEEAHDDGLEGDRGRDAVAGVEDAPAEESKKTKSSKGKNK